MKAIVISCVCALLLGWLTAAGLADVSTVTGSVNLVRAKDAKRSEGDTGVVVWLSPVPKRSATGTGGAGPARQKIVQKNKRFQTSLLAVEVGSIVDFPNEDPFFHNVFSYFDGKRFDLLLYEAGASRHVQFNKAGVCYIFCNIHPQMSAVVVVVDTPYFTVMKGSGEFRISELPLGRYQLNFFAERCSPETLKAASRQVNVEGTPLNLGTITLQESRDIIAVHTNKYGKDYDTPVFSSPIYARP